MCYDSVVAIHDFVDLKLSVNYGESVNGTIKPELSDVEDVVGKQTLLKALYYLSRGNLKEKKACFTCLCHHVAEAIRFTRVSLLVKEAFTSDESMPLGYLKGRFKSWNRN